MNESYVECIVGWFVVKCVGNASRTEPTCSASHVVTHSPLLIGRRVLPFSFLPLMANALFDWLRYFWTRKKPKRKRKGRKDKKTVYPKQIVVLGKIREIENNN